MKTNIDLNTDTVKNQTEIGTDLGLNLSKMQNSPNKGAFEELKVLEGNFVELD